MKTITDHELSEIANDWAKQMPINTGIRTAFAQGYRLAEQKVKNCNAPDVMRSCFNCKNLHSFQGDGDVVCHTYCSERDEIDYTFTNTIDDKKVANECALYVKD